MFLFSLLNAHREGMMVERRSRERLEALQRRKFRALVRHCLARSPYYRELIAERGIDPNRCEVEEFPVLDKATVLENYDRIATDPAVTWSRVCRFAERGSDDVTLMDGRYHVIHTSGSSGQPVYFVCSSDEWARGVAPALRINPYRGKKRKLAFYGIINDHGAGAGMAMSSRRGLLRLAYDTHGFDILRPVEETIAEIDAFKPDIIVGYPTAIYALADAQRSGRMNIAPTFLQCSGEVVFPEHRQAIEQAFGIPLINVYSSSEHLIMGMSRGGGEDMLLFEENFIFEQNEDHTLVTNLFNYTVPLIRYRMNDRLIPAEKPISDRHPYRRVKEIVGRAEGGDLIFTTPEGREERITTFAFGLLSWKKVERFQFHVGNDACRFDFVPQPGIGQAGIDEAIEDARGKLRNLFQGRGLHHVTIAVRPVASIDPDPATGKVRSVVTMPAASKAPQGALAVMHAA